MREMLIAAVLAAIAVLIVGALVAGTWGLVLGLVAVAVVAAAMGPIGRRVRS